MEIADISKQFEQILIELKEIEDLTDDSIVQVAQVILQESGKDRRAELINVTKSSNNGYYSSNLNNANSVDQPATEKQKKALSNFKIPYSEDITKIEASVLLDEAFKKLESKRNGSRKTTFLFSKGMNMKDDVKAVSEDVKGIFGDDMEEYLLSYPFPI